MSFSKKKSGISKKITSLVVLIILLLGLVAGVYLLYTTHINRLQTAYESQITALQMEAYNNKRQVYIPKETVTFGTVLTEDLFTVSDMSSSLSQSLYMTNVDYGKIAKTELTAGIPVMSYMITEEAIQDDIRREEFNMFLLQSNLVKDEFVDVRMMFPNGEDYIVLSKKKIREINLAQNTVWCWLSEREILTISSAIVDAYIHKGTKLYVVTYVAPSDQKESIPTYPANLDVMRLMSTDPNLLDKSKLYLSQQARAALDARIKATPADVASRVQTEVSKEITTVQGTVQTDAISNSIDQSPQTEASPPPVIVPPTEGTTEKEGAGDGFFN